MTNPYLFLDTDGVIQARELSWPDARALTIPVRRPTVTLDFPAHVSDTMLAELSCLSADVHTVSFWCEGGAIDDFVAAVGGPSFTQPVTAPFPGWIACGSRDGSATPAGHDAPCGLPHAPEPRNPAIANDYIADSEWKPRYIAEVLRRDPRPFIWADDREVPVYGRDLVREFAHLPQLMLAPATAVGLTPHDIHRIREFLTSV